MPRKILAKSKDPESTWDQTPLTATEKGQARDLVNHLGAEGKIVPRKVPGTGVSKRTLAKVISGMAMINNHWAKYKDVEVSWKSKKYRDFYKFIYDQLARFPKKPAATGTPEAPHSEEEEDENLNYEVG